MIPFRALYTTIYNNIKIAHLHFKWKGSLSSYIYMLPNSSRITSPFLCTLEKEKGKRKCMRPSNWYRFQQFEDLKIAPNNNYTTFHQTAKQTTQKP